MAYLSHSGSRENEGYCMRPIKDAWTKTIDNANNDPAELYQGSSTYDTQMPGRKPITEIFNVDFLVDRHSSPGTFYLVV